MRIQSQREQYGYWERTAEFAFGDADYQQHAAMVDKRLKELDDAHQDSEHLFRIKGLDGKLKSWSPARRAQQKELINYMWAKNHYDAIPNEGKAVMMGGLGGSGKGFVQGQSQYGLSNKHYLVVNPDDVKEAMAERGMIPHVDGLSPMEASTLVHEEAGDIAKRLAERAYAQKKNVIWDITMSGDDSVQRRIQDMRKAGYGNVDGVFMDADAGTARQRAIDRHRRGEQAFRNGQGQGGRWLPSWISQGNSPTPGSGQRSKNAEVWNRVRPAFNNTIMFDATKGQPTPASVSGQRWAQFMPSMQGQEPALITSPVSAPPMGGHQVVVPPQPLPSGGFQTSPINVPTMGQKPPVKAAAASGDDLPSVRELLGMFEHGQMSFHQLLATLAAHHFEDEDKESGGLYGAHLRAEAHPEDDDFFWVDSAEDRDVITPAQHQAITEAIERATHAHPMDPPPQ